MRILSINGGIREQPIFASICGIRIHEVTLGYHDVTNLLKADDTQRKRVLESLLESFPPHYKDETLR